MIKSRTVSAGAASSQYYAKEGYYTPGSKEAREASEWFGRGAKDAGLVGEVDDAKFDALLKGEAPDGQIMGVERGGERQHRAGLDLTMNAPKEVSVLGLVFGDERLVAVHDQTVREIASYVEDKLMMTRVGVNGSIKRVNAPNVIAGIFRHDTSRAMEPHLHSHTVFANMVKTDLGDKYRSIHNDVISENALVLSQLYHSRMSQLVKGLGYEAGLNRDGRLQVEGLSDLKTSFSTRSNDIDAAIEERGWENSGRNRQLAALMTRDSKQPTDRRELTRLWEKEAEHNGWDTSRRKAFIEAAKERSKTQEISKDTGLDSPSGNGGGMGGGEGGGVSPSDKRLPTARTSDVREAVDFAVRHVSERESVYLAADVKMHALRRLETPDIHGIDREIGRLIKNEQLFSVETEKGLYLSDKETLTAERSVMKSYRSEVRAPGVEIEKSLRHKLTSRRSAEGALANQMRTTSLTFGQREAIKTSLTDDGMYVGVQGLAGTGKTFMLSKMRAYAEKYGYQVEGIAPTNSARVELGKVIPDSRTVTSFLLDHKNNPDLDRGKNRILVVDEAAMISTKDIRDIMQAAREQGIIRVIFQGDIKQLESVGAGVPFKQLQQAGMPVALMDDVQRQKNPDAREAVIHAVRGEVREAFNKVGRVSTDANIGQAVADRWLGLPKGERSETGVLVLTNKRRSEVNDAIRSGLSNEGTLKGQAVRLPTIEPLNLTRAAAGDAASYRGGDTVLAVGQLKSYNIQPDDLLSVVSRDLDKNTITLLREGTSDAVTVKLGQSTQASEKLVAFEDKPREFQIGDLIKFNLADRDANILKGERGTIVNIRKKDATIQMEAGDKAVVSLDSFAARGLDYGYALTAHAYQGQTVKDIIVGMGSKERLATQKALYVQISRVSNQAEIITDNLPELIGRIAKETGESMEALTEVTRSRLQNLLGRSLQNDPSQTLQNGGRFNLENAPSDGREIASKDAPFEASKTAETEVPKPDQDRTKTNPELDLQSPTKAPPEQAEKTLEIETPQGRAAAHSSKDDPKGKDDQRDFLAELEDRVEKLTQDRGRGRGERTR